MNYNWNWLVFFNEAPGGVTYMETLLWGLAWTVGTACLSWVLALSMGTVVGVARTTQIGWARRLGTAYVELLRNIPLLVQMFLWYFVIPELVPRALGDAIKQIPPPWGIFLPAVLCLGFYTSSRVAEQVRAGIESLPVGQRMAGTALGMEPIQVYRYILLPSSFRIILPPLTSELLNLIKNTSVAFTIGLFELVGAARSMQEFSFQVFETFAMATLFYLILNLIVVRGMSLIERRMAVPGFFGPDTSTKEGAA
ncbi:amino acid ABC transporter permease [Parapusillimonas granuli]|uniref:Amino acid ABC transporter permease n=1 Tax=Parapusillimonas granuli TaxID=380911 RepID=A0A853FYK2_9BURK|nr:amino acid ABC transporter permease [Parapusillimonas granuli]MBB5216243.1 glutamate/aspartate transport system permease protein [Parapusillimonas granuli]MEB2400517.1 amino acid ABC transporter permease [Alcaligenaceae bacterium]NYT47920.1 amino acid ABC transporter permease [Parapusillimonas granuli]